MELEAQDGTKLILLMIAGAVFAVVGLWLLLRPKPSGSAAKIELFGMKFESSSAGVLVFLIGAAFLVIPLFVPEKRDMSGGGNEHLPPRQEQPVVPADPPVSGDANGRAALILPPDPEVEESEPNDRIQKANQIGFGQTVSGKLRKGEADWYVIPLPEDAPRDVELRVRHISGRYFSAHLFDSREVEQGWLQSDNGTHYARMDRKGHDRVYVRMTNDIGDGVSYEMSVLPGKEE